MGDLAQAGFRAIAFDMRGHGASEWSKTGAYDIRDFAADLIAAAASMEVKPALVGASLGGLAGLMAEGDLAPGTFASLTGWLPGAPMSTDQWKLLKAGNVASGDLPGIEALGVTPRPLGLFLARWMTRYRKFGRFGVRAKSA